MNDYQKSAFDPVEGSAPEAVSKPAQVPTEEAFGHPRPQANGDPVNIRPENPYGASEEPIYFSSKPPKKKRTGLVIGMGCLLLALLVAGGWWLLNKLYSNPLKDLQLAANRSLDSYMDYIRDLPNLHQYTENIVAFNESNTKHMDVNLSLAGFPEIPDGFSAQLSSDQDVKAKKILINGGIQAENVSVPVDLYMDTEQLQIGSSVLLNAGEAIAVPVQDFGKKWNQSMVFKQYAELPEDFSLSFLVDSFSMEKIEDAFGSDWREFAKSVSYRKATEADGADGFVGAGEVYVLNWDPELLDKLGAKADSKMNTFRIQPKLDEIYAVGAVGAFSHIGQEIEPPKFLISDGMLMGIFIQEKTEAPEKGFIRMELAGESNPWSRMVLEAGKMDAAGNAKETVLSVEYTITVANGQMQMHATATGQDARESIAIDALYKDADGSITVNSIEMGDLMQPGNVDRLDGEALEFMRSMMESVRCLPTQKGCRVEFSLDLSDMISGNLGAMIGGAGYPLEGKIDISMELSPEIKDIQPLAKEPVQLLDLDQTSLGLLAMRIMNNFNSLTNLNFD